MTDYDVSDADRGATEDASGHGLGVLMDQLLQNQQQGAPPAIGSYPAATMPEILFRTAAGVAPFAAQALSNGRYPSIGGTIAGLGAGLAGSFGGAMADEMSRRRLDPLQQRLAIAKQLQGLGTAAGPPEIPQLGPGTTFGLPTGEEAPGTPMPMQVGPPRFNVENIPEQYRIAFAPEIAPLQQYESGKQQIAASKQQIEASKQAVKASEAATETSILERPGIKARTELTGLQAEELKRATTEKARQDVADKALRDFHLANPNASPTVLATKATQLGASGDAVKPILESMNVLDQINYRNQSLALHKQEQGRLAMQFKQTLEKGDVDSARQIVGAEISSINNGMRELRGRITASQKILENVMIDEPTKKGSNCSDCSR